ncbi:HAD-IC family P-type ATPase [Streptosporangium sp. NBC_01495]|uniref:HAD-IC family P-type ATPase n=1 Tax=Streptosporangium sp. NBC_01495 TaxID=2903899 RepID=UPI002E35BE22|nr:HAD-IC family P-type ATPase [Streptosporangium sp. NBC_01495]
MFVPRLLSVPAETLWSVVPGAIKVVPGAVRNALPRSRGKRVCPGGLHVDLRVIGAPGSESKARRLENALLKLEGVERAEVNGILSSVFVGCDPGSINLKKLLAVIEALDGEGADDDDDNDDDLTNGYDSDDDLVEDAEDEDAESDAASSPRPGFLASKLVEHHTARLVERHTRAGIRLGASLVGAGMTFAGRAVHAPPLPPIVPALLGLVESTPRVRDELEHRIGAPATVALFTTANIVTHTLALRRVGMLVQSLTAVGRYIEARDTRRAWEARQHELASGKGSYRHIRTTRKPRPAPMAHSPVDRFERVGGPVAVGATGLTYLFGDSRMRAVAMLTATTPKAAKLGRESFASAIGRAVARRGAIVLNDRALRHMEGIDTVILDADALGTGSWEIDRIIPLGDLDAVNGEGLDGLRARLRTLIDVDDPGARRERDTWKAEPLAGPAGLVTAEAEDWEAQGLRAVRVTRKGVPAALVGMAPQVDPLADAIVAAAKGACAVALAGGDSALGLRLGIDEIVPGGSRLARSIRALQADGHGVAVVSERRMAALAQADLGIGVLRTSGRVPWDADVIAELEEVHLLLSCLAPARKTSERCVWLTAAGTAAGGVLAALGPTGDSPHKAQLASSCTSLATLVTGEWAGWHAGRETPPIRIDRTPWHAMPTKEVLALLGSSANGISEAEALRRRASTGSGEPQGPDSLLRVSAEELANPLTPVLAAGAGLSALVGSVSDSVMIGTVVAANALIGGSQRYTADRALHRLTEAVAVPVRLRRPKEKASTARSPRRASGTAPHEKAGTTRSHEQANATIEDLVPGDVVELRAGDTVPADCRVLKAVGLEIDEAALTGESQLVTKSPEPVNAAAIADRTSMVYEGTTVAAGSGLAVVVAAGEATETARTARLAAEEPPATGVRLRLRELSRRVLPVAVGSGVVLLVADLLRGSSAPQALAPAVSLAVAAVPEGLPFVASVAELASARRLSTRNTLVPNPSTIEALGRVNVLCFDKTGTLTEGRISLRCVSDVQDERPLEDLTPELRHIVTAGMRACPRHDEGRPVPHPTDRAVLKGAERLGVTEKGTGSWERVDELPFEPGRGYHAVLGKGDSGPLLSVKGAPEVVVTRCTSILRDGRVVPLVDSLVAEVEKELDQLARQGYRVLAVAERPASDRRDLDESRIQDLCFLGFLGLADPVRPTAAESVGRLTRAGVRIVMITGDHPSTAEAIGAELNVLNGGRIMTGPELDEMDDDALVEALPDVTVFARTTPAHKARIVGCLRRTGKVVAVTGDGANDAPAIRVADVGIALGSRATPAARAAADIVVTDDRIETIVDAIIEGRAMWSSVRDALSILLGGNIGEIVFAVGSSLLSGGNVLNARQLLLVNLLTDMLPAMAVASRPPTATSPEKLLDEGPEASLGASLTRDIYLRAATTASAAGLAWAIGRMTGTRGRANTMGLVALVASQLLQTLALGSRDRLVVLASLLSLAVLGMTVTVPGLCRFFGCRFLGPVGWTIALGSATATTAAGAAFQASTRRTSPNVHRTATS